MTTLDTGAPSRAQRTPGDALQAALVDLLDLAMAAKQAHWNIYGRGFLSLHPHLDEIAAIARRLADDVAERAVTLGVAPDGRPAAVTATAPDAFPAGRITVSLALTALTSRLDGLVARMRRRIHDTADFDPVTQDLLISVTAELEKRHWMLQAENSTHL